MMDVGVTILMDCPTPLSSPARWRSVQSCGCVGNLDSELLTDRVPVLSVGAPSSPVLAWARNTLGLPCLQSNRRAASWLPRVSIKVSPQWCTRSDASRQYFSAALTTHVVGELACPPHPSVAPGLAVARIAVIAIPTAVQGGTVLRLRTAKAGLCGTTSTRAAGAVVVAAATGRPLKNDAANPGAATAATTTKTLTSDARGIEAATAVVAQGVTIEMRAHMRELVMHIAPRAGVIASVVRGAVATTEAAVTRRNAVTTSRLVTRCQFLACMSATKPLAVTPLPCCAS